MNKLLIVDDEERIVEVLKEYAIFEGFLVDTAYDGLEAVEMAKKNHYDCIIIDIMMPKLNGYEAVKKIKIFDDTPILMVSARSEEYDKLIGFELGIDDYIVKPFSPREVMARVKAVIKRSSPQTEQFTYGKITINKNARQVIIDNDIISITNKEYDILTFFTENIGKALTRKEILNKVWGDDYFGDGRTVDTHMKMLRSHLKDAGEYIKTVHGVGYKFER